MESFDPRSVLVKARPVMNAAGTERDKGRDAYSITISAWYQKQQQNCLRNNSEKLESFVIEFIHRMNIIASITYLCVSTAVWR